MTLQEAIKIAETERKSKVVGAGDCGDKWMFTFEADVNKTDGWVLFVNKENGEVNFILPVLFVESLARGEITCTHMDLNGVVKNESD